LQQVALSDEDRRAKGHKKRAHHPGTEKIGGARLRYK